MKKFLLLILLLLSFVYSEQNTPQKILLRKHSTFHDLSSSNEKRADTKPSNFTKLYGNIVGGDATFFTGITVGSQETLFTVIVDTGSSAMAIPATECFEYTQLDQNSKTKTRCVHNGSLYDYKKSTMSQTFPFNESACALNFDKSCGFVLQYGDGSFTFGQQVEDEFSLGQFQGKMKFGQMEGESPHFASGHIDGIMGMAYHDLDPKNGDVAFERLVKDKQVNDVFSMCLTNAGGEMILGGYDHEKYKEDEIVWTPIIQESYYVVQAQSILVGGKDINVNSTQWGNTIVDSGTTLLALATPIHSALINYMQTNVCPTFPPDIQEICSGSQNIFNGETCLIDPKVLQYFPNISFVFNSTTPLSITPNQYFLTVQSQGQIGYCWAIFDGGALGTIFGDVFMQAFNTIFDRKNQRVGFVPVNNCSESEAMMTGIGTNQTLETSDSSSQPFQIQVSYPDGKPAIGLIVDFSVTKGNAKIQNVRRLTDSQGKCNTTAYVYDKQNTITATLFETQITVDFHIYSPNAKSNGSGLGTRDIILIVVGVLVALIVLTVLGVLFIRFRNRSQDLVYDPTGQDDQTSVLMQPDQDLV